MKKIILSLFGTSLLFAACTKEESNEPLPTPRSDGSGKFTFSVDTAEYRVDTLVVSYLTRDGQSKTTTLLKQDSWNSPDFIYKSGDSIRADVRVVGTLKGKNPLSSVDGVMFKPNPTTIAGPATKTFRSGGTGTLKSGSTFKNTSYTYYIFE